MTTLGALRRRPRRLSRSAAVLVALLVGIGGLGGAAGGLLGELGAAGPAMHQDRDRADVRGHHGARTGDGIVLDGAPVPAPPPSR